MLTGVYLLVVMMIVRNGLLYRVGNETTSFFLCHLHNLSEAFLTPARRRIPSSYNKVKENLNSRLNLVIPATTQLLSPIKENIDALHKPSELNTLWWVLGEVRLKSNTSLSSKSWPKSSRKQILSRNSGVCQNQWHNSSNDIKNRVNT